MSSVALPEDELRVFLRRRRRGSGPVEVPPLAHWLAQTLDLAAKLVPSEAGSLLLDDPSRRRSASPLTFVTAFGPASERLVGMQVPAGQGIAGHVHATGTTYASSSPREDPHFFGSVDESAAFRTRSVVAAPIVLEHQVCGVFELVNRRGRGSFSEADIAFVELLAEYVSRAILNAVDILKQNHLALHDELTGLLNVRGLDRFLATVTRRAEQKAEDDVALLFLDVDRLKRVNDRLGHRAGSELLVRVGRAIDGTVGDRGQCYRFGGDEFVVVLPHTSIEVAVEIATAVRKHVKAATAGPLRHGGALPACSVSVGAASLRASLGGHEGRPLPGPRLLAAADRALYRAKRKGRDRVARATRRDDRLKGA